MAEESKEKKTKRPTALKRDIQNEKKRQEHRSFKSRVKTAIRGFERALSEKDEALTKKSLSEVYSMIDKGVKLGLYKKNKAARTKSKFTTRSL